MSQRLTWESVNSVDKKEKKKNPFHGFLSMIQWKILTWIKIHFGNITTLIKGHLDYW